MSVVITGKYLGDKKIELTHVDSGATIRTVAPKDNNGDGSLFSPTDLFASSLGACMVTIMGILAERDNVSLAGTHFRVEKEMASNPRRVGKLTVEVHLPSALDAAYRQKMENAAKTCPVHHSLGEVEVRVSYLYDV